MKNDADVSSDLVKPRIKLYDRNFAHATSCSNGDLKIYPQYFDWDRSPRSCDIAVFVDDSYRDVLRSAAKIKVWMLLEPPSVSGGVYEMARNEHTRKLFDYILTFDKSLLALDPKFVYYPAGGCWIEEKDRAVHTKTKDISIIASEKNYTVGHKLRHELIKRTKGHVDVYGRGYKFIHNKIEALKDYRFSIVIENCQLDGYFTEKLIDCFVTGTIPLYYGSPSIDEAFNHAGFGVFDSVDSFINLSSINILNTRAEVLYNSRLAAITENFNKAQSYVNTEDWLWLNFFKNICTTTPKT